MVGCIVQSVIVVAKLFYLTLLRAESQDRTHPCFIRRKSRHREVAIIAYLAKERCSRLSPSSLFFHRLLNFPILDDYCANLTIFVRCKY